MHICQKLAFQGKLSFEIIISSVIPWWLHTNLSKFDSVHNIRNQLKFRRICMESSEQNRSSISETVCPTMLVFGKYAFQMLFFQNIPTNPIISKISFLWRHHFRTLYKINVRTRHTHIPITLFQVILDNEDWTEVCKLVTTAKKSCADPTIVPNGQKPFSKPYSNNNIDFFWQFFTSIDQLLWQVLQLEDRSIKPLGSIDREVKEETRLMLNNFFHSVKCPIKMRTSLSQNKLFHLQGN